MDDLEVTPSPRSAVRWGAIVAGAVIAAAISAMLLMAGTGLGFLWASPWGDENPGTSSLVADSIVWLLFTQILAYGVAGYVTGRLRTTWADTPGDEIYFRDTAHGFLAWALSVVISVVLLGSTAASWVSGAATAGAVLTGAGTGAVTPGEPAPSGINRLPIDYFTDLLLRPNAPTLPRSNGDLRQEVARILKRSVAAGRYTEADQRYLASLIMHRAGVDQVMALSRLEDVRAQARQAWTQAEQQDWEAADGARKALAAFSLWAFASLLVGAFVASWSATVGGRAREY
jgi:hypothetical protein